MELLQIGDRLPSDALVHDHEGRPRAIASFLGREGVLLYFMRAASCPICQRHVIDLGGASGAALIGTGRAIVALVPEDPARAALARQRTGNVLPVLSAPELYVALGFRRVLFGGIQQSGTVLVARDGAIVRVHRASLPTNALPGELLRAA